MTEDDQFEPLKEPATDAINDIITIVTEILHDVDQQLLTQYLKSCNWAKITGKEWAHLKTVEQKAQTLATFAKARVAVLEKKQESAKEREAMKVKK